MVKKSSKILRYLRLLSPDESTAELKELYRLFPAVREYYQTRLSDDGEVVLLNKYKKSVKDEFMPERGLGRARLSVARKAVSDFTKLSRIPMNTAEIMLYYVEMGVTFTNAYGDIDDPFYNSIEGMYEKAAKFVTKQHLAKAFQARFRAIVRDTAHIGWGFHDALSYVYEQYFREVT